MKNVTGLTDKMVVDRLPWRTVENVSEIKPAPKPHKWAEVIKAWADGKTVQYRIPGERPEWTDISTETDVFWNGRRSEFRIKPDEPKVQWFRTMVTAYGVDLRDTGIGTVESLRILWHTGSPDKNGAIRIESVDGVITKLEFFTKDQVEQMLKEGQQ